MDNNIEANKVTINLSALRSTIFPLWQNLSLTEEHVSFVFKGSGFPQLFKKKLFVYYQDESSCI